MSLTLREIQEVIRNAYFHRDYARGLWRTLLWLVEELGELVSVINKEKPREQIEEELADVLAWLVSVANLLEIDLEKAFIKKYREDVENYFKSQKRVK